jgi:hypothetical protein
MPLQARGAQHGPAFCVAARSWYIPRLAANGSNFAHVRNRSLQTAYAVQVAHFLKAPTQPWVAAFWAAVQPGWPEDADSAGLGLVTAAGPSIAALLCDGHPAVRDAQLPLTSKLCNAPVVAHAAAARACVQQATEGAQLALEFDDEQLAQCDSSAGSELAQRAFAAIQALPQRPAAALGVFGTESDVYDSALAAAEQYADLAGDASVMSLRIAPGHQTATRRPFTDSAIVCTAEQCDRVCGLLQCAHRGLTSLQFVALNSHMHTPLGTSTYPFSSFLPSLSALTALRKLCITDCTLATASCSIDGFTAALVGLQSLAELELVECTMCDSFCIVVSALGQLPQLAHLKLLDNYSAPYATVVDAAPMPGLTYLELRSNDVRAAGDAAMASGIAGMPALRQLAVTGMGVDDVALGCLEQSCGALRALQALEFGEERSDSHFGDDDEDEDDYDPEDDFYDFDPDIAALMRALPCPGQLTRLRLHARPAADGAKDLLHTLRQFTGLQELYLQDFYFLGNGDEQGVALLAELLPRLPRLQSLRLRGRDQRRMGIRLPVDRASIRVLAGSLPQLVQLSRLELRGVLVERPQPHLGMAGVPYEVSVDMLTTSRSEPLAEVLPALSELVVLDLSDNELDDWDLRALAPALTQLTHLADLALARNELRNCPLLVLRVASRLSSLARLDIRENFGRGLGSLLHRALLGLPVMQTVEL